MVLEEARPWAAFFLGGMLWPLLRGIVSVGNHCARLGGRTVGALQAVPITTWEEQRMKAIKLVGAGLLAMAPMVGFAAAPGYVDLYYIPNSSVEVDAAIAFDDDGDGFGAKVMAPVSEWGVLTGEYQTVKLDDTDIDVEQIRFGLGVLTGGAARMGVLAEYIRLDLESSAGSESPDGFGLHGRLEFDPSPGFTLHGQIGYVRVEDQDEYEGLEMGVGIAANINEALGMFIDYRLTRLEDTADVEYDFADVRVGVRVNFGV